MPCPKTQRHLAGNRSGNLLITSPTPSPLSHLNPTYPSNKVVTDSTATEPHQQETPKSNQLIFPEVWSVRDTRAVTHTPTHTQTHTLTGTDSHTDTHKYSHTNTHTHRHTHTLSPTHTHTQTHTHTPSDTHSSWLGRVRAVTLVTACCCLPQTVRQCQK